MRARLVTGGDHDTRVRSAVFAFLEEQTRSRGESCRRIVIDPQVLAGKPAIKGTRLAVEFIIHLPADGWPEEQVMRSYPGVTADDIRACLAYASDVLHAEKVYPVAQ